MKRQDRTEGEVAGEILLTTSECARELGISRATAWVKVVRGELPGRKVGPLFLISRVDLERYRAQNPPRHEKRAS